MPWARKVPYKYIVDGRWTTTDDQPTELDSIGNLNNVYNSPVRPPTPKALPPAAAPEPVAQTVTPTEPAGKVNGIFLTAKKAAVGMVEAIAPGTTKTPTSESAPSSSKAPETNAPPESVAVPVREEIKAPEVSVESVLPTAPETTLVAPDVPITVLPLAAETPDSNGVVEKTLETTVVEGAATTNNSEGDAVSSNAQAEASTHEPVANGVEGAVSRNAALNGGANQHSEEKPQDIPLPAPTPSEIVPPTTPTTNGKHNGGESTTSTPSASPRKEKRGFPTFGRHHRHSSNASFTDEQGQESPSRNGSVKKKRTSSFFGKIKNVFNDDHGKALKEKK